MQDGRPLASRNEVAEYLGVPKRTLEKWAYFGKGPKFSKIGRYARYQWVDVESWVTEQQEHGADA